MTSEEQLILDFLHTHPGSACSRLEIARRAVKRTVYERDRHWADQPLAALVARNLVEIDGSGYYQLRRR